MKNQQVSNGGIKLQMMNRAFIEPYAKFILNIKFFREIILVKLGVNEVS